MSQKITISPKKILAGDVEQIRLLLRVLKTDLQQSANGDHYLPAEQLDAALDALQTSELDVEQDITVAAEWAAIDRTLEIRPEDKAWIEFIDGLFTTLYSQVKLDHAAEALVYKLRIPFLQAVHHQEGVLSQTDNFVARTLDLIHTTLLTWYEAMGKSGEALFAAIRDVCEHIQSQARRGDVDVWRAQFERLAEFVEKEQQRVQRLEQRLADAETGAIRAKLAQRRVIELLNSKLPGAQLPAFFLNFVHGPLREELAITLVKRDDTDALLKRWRAVLESAAWIFNPGNVVKEKQRAFKLAPLLTAELHGVVAETFTANNNAEAVAVELESSVANLLTGRTVETQSVPALALPGQIEGVEAVLSQALIKETEQISEGDWFTYITPENVEIRCKLLKKIPEIDQWLFVNRNGQKVLQKSVADIAYCLTSNVMKPLQQAKPCGEIIKAHLNRLLQEFEEKQDDIKAAQAKRAEEKRIAEDKRMELQAAKQAAAEKARAEAAALAKAKAEQQRLAQEQAEREEQIRRKEALAEEENRAVERRKIAKLTLDSLNIGAWMEMPDKHGEPVKCKLAVKINSTGKFVFVDSTGIKVGEFVRDELIEKLMDQTARVLQQAENFEDRLAKVVGSLRKDKS